jgi:4-amino-4-deoxy-L-arabinose transferase-like glycosyltransferase
MSFFNKNVMAKIKVTDILKQNWLLILILLVGAFMRLYKIDSYMTFLGDEGRDAIIVRNLLVHFDPILIGPGTSVGNMYLGPLYYYFMAPFLFLSNFSPVGPAVGVALLGLATIYLVYITGKDWFEKTAGLIAALFFAISPTVIVYSRSSWNPNIMPFFALLSVYAIWKVYKHKQSLPLRGKQYIYLILSAISFAFVLQSHYLGVLLLPVILIYWFLSKVPKKYTLVSISIFLFLMSPLLIFDIRHDWMNTKALYKFLTIREEVISVNPLNSVSRAYPLFEQINSSMITAKTEPFGQIVSISIILFLILIPFSNKKIFILWLISGIIGLGLYKQNVYDHYFGFMFPIPFLLIGFFWEKLYNSKYKIFGILFLGILIFINLANNPLRNSPNNQMKRAENVANKIIEESKDKYFNIAVVAEQNYEDGYQYILEKNNSKMIEIDAQLTETVTDQLFVICEKIKEECDPTHSAKAEVANFGWSIINQQWTVDGVTIYKLIHTK